MHYHSFRSHVTHSYDRAASKVVSRLVEFRFEKTLESLTMAVKVRVKLPAILGGLCTPWIQVFTLQHT